jgi:hypothetical protein
VSVEVWKGSFGQWPVVAFRLPSSPSLFPLYSACLFCNKPLGTNEAIDTFPVGRRLAFDAAKGRLWVVCRQCERWNLSPLEERWEAIEQAEELYRDARRRATTEHIGLARLRDDTELVRIGEPLRPEFAAWRYGDQFGRRRQRQMIIAGAGVAALSAVIVGGAVAGASIGGFGWLLAKSGRSIVQGDPEKVVAKIRTETAGTVSVRRRHLAETSLFRGTDGPLALHLRFKNGQAEFQGREAMRIAAIILPHVNRYGGTRQTVAEAVGSIESSGGVEPYLELLSDRAHVVTRPLETHRKKLRVAGMGSSGLFGLSTVDRLALEMALHEDAERRALEGELAELERAWKDAEEIAAIADDMFVPGSVQRAFDRMRGKG